jgi:hypothetical protein
MFDTDRADVHAGEQHIGSDRRRARELFTLVDVLDGAARH